MQLTDVGSQAVCTHGVQARQDHRAVERVTAQWTSQEVALTDVDRLWCCIHCGCCIDAPVCGIAGNHVKLSDVCCTLQRIALRNNGHLVVFGCFTLLDSLGACWTLPITVIHFLIEYRNSGFNTKYGMIVEVDHNAITV